MRTTFIHFSQLVLCFFLLSQSASARVWRVNNTSGISADFVEISTAISDARVVDGDTLYVEGSSTPYQNSQITKRLTIYGPGYFLGSTENTGLQVSPLLASVGTLELRASGCTIMGLNGAFGVSSLASNTTISRCFGTVYDINLGSGTINNLIISKSYLRGINLNSLAPKANLQLVNCILGGGTGVIIGNVTSVALIRNNTFYFSSLNTDFSYISNNIFHSSGFVQTNSSVVYNYSTGNNLPSTGNNQNNIASNLFEESNPNSDVFYRLKTTTPAKGGGEPMTGFTTPDAGAYGTDDPYVPSGIPPIPTIYRLTVPASVPSTATTMEIILSTRSNN